MVYKDLKVELFRKNISYEEVSKGIGISKSAFINKINGKTDFTLDEAINIASLLKLSNNQKRKIFHF